MDPTVNLPKILLQLQAPHLFNLHYTSAESADIERHFRRKFHEPSNYEELEKLIKGAMTVDDAIKKMEEKQKQNLELEPQVKTSEVQVPVKTSGTTPLVANLVYTNVKIEGWNIFSSTSGNPQFPTTSKNPTTADCTLIRNM